MTSRLLLRSRPHATALPDAAAPVAWEGSWLGETLDRLLEHVRALLQVDAGAVLVTDPNRRLVEPVAGWFSSPTLGEMLEAAERRPYDRARPGLVELALERERPVLLPRVDAWEAAADLQERLSQTLGRSRAARVWSVGRSASVIACPLRTEGGGALGVLLVASLDDRHPLGAADLRTAEGLADLAALALERSELLESEARRAREELLLKRAAEDMSSSLELDEVYGRIVTQAAHVTGARKALLTRLDRGVSELAVVASHQFSRGFAQRRLGLDRGKLGEVARTREPYLSNAADVAEWDRNVTETEGIGSFMHAPIELGPRLFGVLTVAHEQVDRFTPADLELLGKLARSSAAAIANAIDFERERRIARALTLGFVPESLPEVPGHETGVLYAPSANEPTGGDIYGAWPLPGGEVAVLVGDVAGKGVETAALSSMVRFFIEARCWDSTSPSVVLSQANAMLAGRLPSDTFVTAFLGVLTPGGLRYTGAGHLPPLLVRDGAATELDGHGVPLGIDRSPDYGESELALSPGDLVFAYTDGLIEPRRRGEIYGSARLARLVVEQSRDLAPQALVTSVHEQVRAWADGLSDDAVALAIRRRG